MTDGGVAEAGQMMNRQLSASRVIDNDARSQSSQASVHEHDEIARLDERVNRLIVDGPG